MLAKKSDLKYNSSSAIIASYGNPGKILAVGQKPSKWALAAEELENSKWYPQVMGLDTQKHETDKLAGKNPRLFVAGLSKWQILFQKPD